MKKAIALLLTFVTLLSFANAKEDLAAEDLHIPAPVKADPSLSRREKRGGPFRPHFACPRAFVMRRYPNRIMAKGVPRI